MLSLNYFPTRRRDGRDRLSAPLSLSGSVILASASHSILHDELSTTAVLRIPRCDFVVQGRQGLLHLLDLCEFCFLLFFFLSSLPVIARKNLPIAVHEHLEIDRSTTRYILIRSNDPRNGNSTSGLRASVSDASRSKR